MPRCLAFILLAALPLTASAKPCDPPAWYIDRDFSTSLVLHAYAEGPDGFERAGRELAGQLQQRVTAWSRLRRTGISRVRSSEVTEYIESIVGADLRDARIVASAHRCRGGQYVHRVMDLRSPAVVLADRIRRAGLNAGPISFTGAGALLASPLVTKVRQLTREGGAGRPATLMSLALSRGRARWLLDTPLGSIPLSETEVLGAFHWERRPEQVGVDVVTAGSSRTRRLYHGQRFRLRVVARSRAGKLSVLRVGADGSVCRMVSNETPRSGAMVPARGQSAGVFDSSLRAMVPSGRRSAVELYVAVWSRERLDVGSFPELPAAGGCPRHGADLGDLMVWLDKAPVVAGSTLRVDMTRPIDVLGRQ